MDLNSHGTVLQFIDGMGVGLGLGYNLTVKIMFGNICWLWLSLFQFNFKFDIETDMYAEESISLLQVSWSWIKPQNHISVEKTSQKNIKTLSRKKNIPKKCKKLCFSELWPPVWAASRARHCTSRKTIIFYSTSIPQYLKFSWDLTEFMLSFEKSILESIFYICIKFNFDFNFRILPSWCWAQVWFSATAWRGSLFTPPMTSATSSHSSQAWWALSSFSSHCHSYLIAMSCHAILIVVLDIGISLLFYILSHLVSCYVTI